MSNRPRRILFAAALAAMGGIFTFVGCEEKDVPVVVDADEVIRYVAETTEGRQLFAWENFILPTPYEVPSDSAVYRDSLISHTREYRTYLVPLKWGAPDSYYDSLYGDWGALGDLREAVVLVYDDFEVQTTRQYSADTVVDTSLRTLERSAFFLKFGDDSKEYAGWVLWGYNGTGHIVPDAVVRVRLYDNSEFSGDGSIYMDEPKSMLDPYVVNLPFVRVDALNQIVVGSRVVVKISRTPTKPSAYDLISGIDTGGVFMRSMISQDTASIDTIRSPWSSQHPPQYGLYYIQSFNKSQSRFLQSYCIPFKM